MTGPGPWAGELLERRLAQPDQRSCGATVLVVAEALRNEVYARRLVAGGPEHFEAEVLAMHRRTTGVVDVAGRLQPPWPRLLGTPPWAVARQLTARSGVPHRVLPVWPWARRGALRRLRSSLAAGHPVPLYVGALLPRHVVLALPAGDGSADRLTVLEPSRGRRRPLHPQEFLAGSLGTCGWPVPWFLVAPRPVVARRRLSRPRGRRTPA